MACQSTPSPPPPSPSPTLHCSLGIESSRTSMCTSTRNVRMYEGAVGAYV